MAATDYENYIMREPLAVGKFAPLLHVCGEKHRFGDGECPGSRFPDFPAEQTFMYIKEPFLMNTPTHAHDNDQLLYILGGNPANFFEFDAEVDITLGEEGNKYTINTTSIIFIPKGLMHCPIDFRRIDKPIIFGHCCFASTYTRSTGDMTAHPTSQETYPEEDIIKMRRGII